MIKGIIFDFDGVIIDTETRKFKDLNSLLKNEGYNLKKNEFLDMIGKKTHIFLGKKFPEMPLNLIKDVSKQRKKLQFENIEKYELIKGIKELLTFLKFKKYVIAVTTGSSKTFVEELLKINKIYDYFNIIITGEDFSSSKPNPECYELTLKKMNLKSSELIIVEDSPAGITAAKKLDCNVFAIKTYLDEKELFEADDIFKNHLDILKHFKTK